MDSAFNEYIVKKQPDLKTMLIKIGIIALGLLLVFVIMVVLSQYLMGFNLVLAAGVIYGAWKLMGMFNVEFEYSVIQDELYIDKIMNRQKRKRLVKSSCKNFELLAPVGEKYKREFESECAVTLDCSSSPTAEKRWFFIYQGKKGRTKVIFEPTDRMINDFRVFVRSKIMN